MLAAHRRQSGSRRPWTYLERLDLATEKDARLGEYGLIDQLAFERGITRFAVHDQLRQHRACLESNHQVTTH